MKQKYWFFLAALVSLHGMAQHFSFNANTTGQRVCLVSSEINMDPPSVTIKLLDAAGNTSHPTNIYRRPLYGNGSDWVLVASNLAAGTTQWTDTNVLPGSVWEYQVKRTNTWFYASQSWDATGYTVGSLLADQSGYQGQLILLVADNIPAGLSQKYTRLKKELTGEGWFVNEIIVPKATSWDSGNAVVGIRNQVISVYNSAPANDKPKMLFILGHVPMSRSGSTTVTAPDAHDQNKGARGCDAYYADIDGIYTDGNTFNPGNLQTALAINNPGDFKWDQDFLPSDIEMAFGRVDFQDITDLSATELQLTETYLDKLSNYRNVAAGFEMGGKTGFYLGYDNSNDGSYRILPNISKSADVYQNTSALPHPQWVQENGPFMMYMQNQSVPEISEWNTYGMNATIFTSDQSYWGYSDMPQTGVYGRIRALLGTNTKCLVTLWTTTGMNIFHQACSGGPLGLAVKEIVNHNTTNNKLQKPPQNWDTADWWNRTHFAYNGDPTLRLYQTKPAADLAINDVGGQAVLSWTGVDDGIAGYQVYKSNSEFGIYTKITTIPITTPQFTDPDYHVNDWYMVRQVKIVQSGCGEFYNPSLGIFAKGDFVLSANPAAIKDTLRIWPNPAKDKIYTSGFETGSTMSIFDAQGRKMGQFIQDQKDTAFDISGFASGLYFINAENHGNVATFKFMAE